ncbi:hypothetical protein BCT82_05435 [Vibrio breoganii]|uniref:tetratricopeptide repeat protein n=1 Tax=Vibrio breoganii TaxID=553239 RepID=UPI000C837037|nr:tetratricopeptide repeat protein [Vibrio breoganii]PML28906.1 hypothetical protein BCT82_05435 [Vibrio breoganii]
MSAESTIKYAYNSVESEANTFERQKAAKSLYEKGRDLIHSPNSEEDISLGIRKIFQAQSLKYPQALYAFGRIHLDGEYVKQDTSIGISHLKNAQYLGNTPASFELSLFLYENTDDEKIELDSYRNIKKLAKNGYEPAALWLDDDLLKLSECFLNGVHVFPSKHKALSLLNQAVEEKLVTDIPQLEDYMLNFQDLPVNFYQSVEKLKLEILSSDELVDIANRYLESPSVHIRNKAFVLFKRAAENDDEYGLLGMAKCYEKGIGCPINDREANRLYQILTDEYSIGEAAFKLAERVDEQIVQDSSTEISAFYYYCKAATQGFATAAIRAFEILESDETVLNENIRGELLEELDQYSYEFYLFSLKDSDRLKLCLLALACQNDAPETYYQYAQAIENLLLNTELAQEQYEIAANLGHSHSALKFAQYLEQREKKEAAHPYLLIAAKADIEETFEKVAWNFYQGDVCVEDRSQAEYWFKKSALTGDVDSMYMLGHCYLYDRDTPEYDKLAVVCFEHAANLSSLDAHYELGRCYHNGWGVQVDYLTAKEHYNKARSQRTDDVLERLEELDKLVWEYYEENHNPLK